MSDLLSYARRFVLKYSQIVDEVPLQIYCAGLIFAPRNAIRKMFEADLPTWLSQLPQLPQVAASWSPEIQVLEGHEDDVFNVVFSSDSRVLVSLSALSIRIWDHTTGTLLHSLPVDPSDQYLHNLVVLSPDGQLLASVSQSGMLKLWDTVTGAFQQQFSTDPYQIRLIKFSPDSRLLTYISGSGQLQLFDTWRTSSSTFKGYSEQVYSLAFSPDSLCLASGYADGTVEICELAVEKLKHRFKCHPGPVNLMAFSPDGLLLASTSVDESIANLWSIARGVPQHEIDVGPKGSILKLVFSPNSQKIVFKTRDGTKVWDLRTGDQMGVLDVVYSQGWYELAFSPDSALLVAAGTLAVFVWDCENKPRELEIHSHLMHSAALAPNSQSLLLASGCQNGLVRLWDLATPRASDIQATDTSKKTERLWTSEMTDLVFSHGGRLLVSTSSSGQIVIWDAVKQIVKDEIKLKYPFDGRMAFAYDSPILAITQPHKILLWDLLKRRPLKKTLEFIDFQIYYEEKPLCLATSKNGQLAFSLRSKIRLWDIETGAKLHYWKLGGNIKTLEFVGDGPYLRTNFGIPGPGEDVFSQNSLPLRLLASKKVEQVRKQLSSTVPRMDDGTMIGEMTTTNQPSTRDREELRISLENQWIMLNDERVLWLPPDVRPQGNDDENRTRIAIHGRKIALPHSAGHVCFVEFRT